MRASIDEAATGRQSEGGAMKLRVDKKVLRLLALLAMAVALLGATATVASAAPSEPTLDIATLEGLLDASPSGSLTGYLKTVTKGSTIETIPVEVMAVTGGSNPASALILFEASGDKIDKYGGIVAGMSGSPIYVDDAGTDKLVGALSYGDWFTLSGTGLATPIEFMSDIEADYVVRVAALSTPELVNGRLIDRVIVANQPERFGALRDDGAFIARPLASVYIGGIDPRSRVFKRLAAEYKSAGVDVVPLQSALAGTKMVDGQPFETTLTGGAAIAALASRGDLWAGGIGTVTYAADGNVVAFGHPMYWDGDTSQYMANAWIDGIWPSAMIPYKLGRPGAIAGEIQQDRNAGIMGVEGAVVDEVPITSRAVDLASGRVETSTVYMPSRQLNDARIAWPWLSVYAGYVAPGRLYDQWFIPGSAHTTTTIVVGDGTTTHTIKMVNVVDDRYDVTSAVINDLWIAVESLTQVFDYGLEDLDIQSIDLESEISEDRIQAEIVDIDLPNGLKAGANPVVVSLLAFGEPATQTVETTLTIPADVPLNGTIVASSDTFSFWYDDEEMMDEGGDEPTDRRATRPTIAKIVKSLNDTTPNNVLTISYQPSEEPVISGDEEEEEAPVVEIVDYDPVETSVTTGWYVVGAAEKITTALTASAYPSTINYGGTTYIWGSILGPEEPVDVSIYGRAWGSSQEKLLATTTALPGEFGLDYEAPIKLTKNTSIRVRFDGDDTYELSEATTSVKVRAKVTAKSSSYSISRGGSVTLSTSVLPTTTAGGQVRFEYRNPTTGVWKSIATKTLTAGTSAATASLRWKPPAGTIRVRVRYLGGTTNVATTSSYITIRVE